MIVTIPIRGADHECCDQSFDSFLAEISQWSNNEDLMFLINDENEQRKIKSLVFETLTGNRKYKTEPEPIAKLRKRHRFFQTDYIIHYLVIDLTTELDEHLEDDYIQYVVNGYLERLSLLLHLSFATNVDFMTGVVYSTKGIYLCRTKMIMSNLMHVYEDAHDMQWPTMVDVRLADTIAWYMKFNLHPNNKSQSNVHRSINAFSYLFGSNFRDDSGDLFWIMLGIESLLAEGTQGISQQIREKSTIILGKPTAYAKKLNKLYEYRSRLIHGDFDIFPKFYDDYQSFHEEYHDYLNFASSILIALIRQLIRKQESKFAFQLMAIN